MRTENLTVKREWHKNGQISYEEYWINGEKHNTEGPAFRSWYKNGQIHSKVYWINGKLHNTEGPAFRSWDENGQISYEEYWINGEKLSKEECENEVKKDACNGKVVEIDGKKYKLQAI
mgnify:CR=1 FL=1